MNAVIITKTYKEPSFNEKEILRYAGCKSADKALLQHLQRETDHQMRALMQECINEVRGRLSYKVCYRELPLLIQGTVGYQLQASTNHMFLCDFEHFRVHSADLAKNLLGCDKVILFAATIGVEMDRLIGKYSRISPAKALMMQAIGAERIEALCDMFCEDMEKAYAAHESTVEKADLQQISDTYGLRPRFSPGYGDLPLEVQRDIFQLLDCPKQIGLSLNDSLLMSPSKSVTAFVGIPSVANSTSTEHCNNCTACSKTDCAFREDIE